LKYLAYLDFSNFDFSGGGWLKVGQFVAVAADTGLVEVEKLSVDTVEACESTRES